MPCWAAGETQAVEIYQDDLGRLERDLVGMARYRVLLRAGLVEPPVVAFSDQALDAVGQDRSLAGPSAGNHQHRSVDVLDGFVLAIIWKKRRKKRRGT